MWSVSDDHGSAAKIVGKGNNACGRGGRARRGAIGEGGGRWEDGRCAGVEREQEGL